MKKLNLQNSNLKLLKKVFNKQKEQNELLIEQNNKIHTRLAYYVSNKKITEEQFNELKMQNVVKEDMVDDIDKWLEVNEEEIKSTDFLSENKSHQYSHDVDETECKMKKKDQNTHVMFVGNEDKKIVRNFIEKKSYSFNLHDREIQGRGNKIIILNSLKRIKNLQSKKALHVILMTFSLLRRKNVKLNFHSLLWRDIKILW